LRGFVSFFLRSVIVNDYVRAFRSKAQRYRAAQPLGGASDQSYARRAGFRRRSQIAHRVRLVYGLLEFGSEEKL
jgi:hypothetical protein